MGGGEAPGYREGSAFRVRAGHADARRHRMHGRMSDNSIRLTTRRVRPQLKLITKTDYTFTQTSYAECYDFWRSSA
jgi:hypothetical protein